MFSSVIVYAQRKRSATKQKTIVQIKKPKGKTKKNTITVKQNEFVKNESKEQTLQPSQDTSKLGSVTVYASFKPVLRSAAKINFTASATELDTNRFSLNYNIPAQNLIFSYQPVPIKPLALTSDSEFTWQNHQYIKAGFGNYTTPYFETGMAFGHPTSALYTVFGKFVSSKGNLAYQENTNAYLKLCGAFGGITNHELLTSVSYNLSNQNKYGVTSKPGYTFNKDSLQQNFNTIEADISLHSKSENIFGISYHPELKAAYFFDNNKAHETSFNIKVPFTKSFTSSTSFNIGLNAAIANYISPNNKSSNNIFSINPSLKISQPDYFINAGMQPTWDNSVFSFLPNIFGEFKFKDEFIITAGWVGYFKQNTYKSLAAYNPFIEQPKSFVNTKVSEIYGGLKGSVGKHFTYNGQVSFLKYTNQTLFVNDADIKKSQTFNILYEPNLTALKILGEIGYTDKEKFNFISSFKLIQFTSQDSFPKPYGIIPLEITGTLKYKLMKDVFIKSDLFFITGSSYRVQTIETSKTNAALDLNIGAECKVLKNLNVYLDFNNLFNNQYQRWNQYQTFGFNVIGGVVYSFR
jgi:hypothetical protein